MKDKTLIFDVGGIIIDDSYENIVRELGLTAEKAKLLKPVLDDHPLFGDLMLGNIGQIEFMERLINEFPEYRSEIEETFKPENQHRMIPIVEENLNYILNLKERHKIYLLSNMSDITYKYLNPIIERFDGGVFSFQEHLKKPDPKFYEMLLNKYDLSHADCIFFDDRRHNVDAGNRLGIESYLFKRLQDVKEIGL